MRKPKSIVDETEVNFDLNGELWTDYLEWCESGYVLRDSNGIPVAISTKPSPKDFEIWKQGMGYYDNQVEDE